MDYFALFGLSVGYGVDTALLASRYQQLQRQFHPDRYVLHAESQRLVALQQSLTINDAYQTLKHPLKRAEYILLLQGIDINNAQQSMSDSAFLTEQFILREELNAMAEQPGAESVLPDFAAKLAAMSRQCMAQMLHEFDCQHWPQAAESVRKLYFFGKLQQQVEDLEEKLLDNLGKRDGFIAD